MELRWSPPKRTPNLLSAKAANTLLGVPLYQQKAIKTCRMEHQDTKMTSMRPRLKELNDNPYIIGITG